MESTDQKKDNTDNAPIRPVSSLLSHFENLSHTRSASAVTASHDPSFLKSPVQPDEPRHVAAASVSSGIRRHNRPMSMNLHDSPQLGPTLTVDSPRSPPRGFEERQISDVHRVSRTPPPSLPGPRPPVSDETEQASAAAEATDAGIGHLSPGESRFTPREGPAERKSKSASLPPPANRAGKPKIPAKPANLSHQDTGNGGTGAGGAGGGGDGGIGGIGGIGLTPRSKRASSDLRVSPFSTPPSSPEKPSLKTRNSHMGPSTPSRPDVESPAQRLFEERFPPPGPPPRDARELGFSRPKPPQRVPSRDTKPSRDPTPLSVQIPSGQQQQQQQQQRSAEPGSTVSSLPSAQRAQAGDILDRPGLPPRREAGQGGRNGLSPSRATPTEYTYTHSVSRHPEPPQPQQPQQPQLPQRELQTPTLVRQPSYSRENKPGYQAQPAPSLPPQPIQPSPQAQPQPQPRIRTDNGEEPNQQPVGLMDYPDTSSANRRPPFIKNAPKEIATRYDTRLMDVCGKYVCTTGYLTRVWDLTTGEQIMTLPHGETVKNISISFRPGATLETEGQRLWLGTNTGELQEVDIPTRSIVATRSYPSRREVIKILRHKKEMWTMDDEGRLLIWPPDETGVPNLQYSYHNPYDRVAKGQTFSMVVGDELWLATGKDVHVYQPSARDDASFRVLRKPLGAQHTGEVTSGAYTTKDGGRVYLGHADGKVSVYDVNNFALLAMVNVSVYKISCLSVVGDYLWAGYKTGMIYVYDIHSNPWTVKKDWRAHDSPVSGIVLDTSSVWTMNRLQVTSLGDNCIRLWDGTLESDWLESRMQSRDVEFCTFREARAVIMTWNAGASTPGSVRTNTFIQDAIHPEDPPEILVFGFQELVDLEDKKITAKSLLMGSKKKEKKEAGEKEHMSRQYRVWIEHLTRCINDRMPLDDSYVLIHSANLIGLFTCVFVRHRERHRISNLRGAEVKRGMGGLYGNKGALVLRFLFDDSSVCLVNCHLAAGQTHTAHRNNDIAAILEAECLPVETSRAARANHFVSGGDGSMIIDHEICILNGDLNYRIDSIPRHIIIDAVRQNNLPKLLERDQLLASRRKNPGFRLRSFTEAPITFAPTYKYDVGTDEYDSSDKKRSPAWCDRVLSRGRRLQQVYYRRLEVRASDHRPVTAYFKMNVKSVSEPERAATWESCQAEFQKERRRLTSEASIEYLISVLGTDPKQARSLILG